MTAWAWVGVAWCALVLGAIVGAVLEARVSWWPL